MRKRASGTSCSSISVTACERNRLVLPARVAGNEVESIVMPHQVRIVSRDRSKHRLERLTASNLRADIENRLLDHFGVGLAEDDA